jgi:predicted enzyme related to lactoylglutathione lyase
MPGPLFHKVDCVMVRVADLDAAITFYSSELGHPVLWRTPAAAGLQMPESDAELVLHTDLGPEVDLLVESVDEAIRRFVAAGGEIVNGPFDIAIGRCAVVRDPFGNSIVMLDRTKGALVTNATGNVVGVEKP